MSVRRTSRSFPETNQALNYLMTLYLKEGDSVIAEEPIVPDNVSIFRNKGLNLVTVPMEQDGMDLKKLEQLDQETSSQVYLYDAQLSQPDGPGHVFGEASGIA